MLQEEDPQVKNRVCHYPLVGGPKSFFGGGLGFTVFTVGVGNKLDFTVNYIFGFSQS